MVTIKELTNKPCILCDKTDDTADVRFKDGRFADVEGRFFVTPFRKRRKELAERIRKSKRSLVCDDDTGIDAQPSLFAVRGGLPSLRDEGIVKV